jgi:hypothetical protein
MELLQLEYLDGGDAIIAILLALLLSQSLLKPLDQLRGFVALRLAFHRLFLLEFACRAQLFIRSLDLIKTKILF